MHKVKVIINDDSINTYHEEAFTFSSFKEMRKNAIRHIASV